MSAPKKVAIILSSSRHVRVGPSVVEVIEGIIKTSPAKPAPVVSVLDVAAFNLPVFNEKIMPAMVPAHGQFEHQHSKDWSAAIESFDGYIFVTPEYNFGVPGSVKNAVDYLYNDWIGKPIVVVSYGIKGGMSANESLNTTLVGMKLRVAKTRPSLTFRGEGMTEVFLAGGQGVLGPESKKDWEGGESRASILKAFEELVELLEAPAAEEAKTE